MGPQGKLPQRLWTNTATAACRKGSAAADSRPSGLLKISKPTKHEDKLLLRH